MIEDIVNDINELFIKAYKKEISPFELVDMKEDLERKIQESCNSKDQIFLKNILNIFAAFSNNYSLYQYLGSLLYVDDCDYDGLLKEIYDNIINISKNPFLCDDEIYRKTLTLIKNTLDRLKEHSVDDSYITDTIKKTEIKFNGFNDKNINYITRFINDYDDIKRNDRKMYNLQYSIDILKNVTDLIDCMNDLQDITTVYIAKDIIMNDEEIKEYIKKLLECQEYLTGLMDDTKDLKQDYDKWSNKNKDCDNVCEFYDSMLKETEYKESNLKTITFSNAIVVINIFTLGILYVVFKSNVSQNLKVLTSGGALVIGITNLVTHIPAVQRQMNNICEKEKEEKENKQKLIRKLRREYNEFVR